MDYRNDNRTPRDRVDEEFFRSILRDEDPTDEMRLRRTSSRMNDSHMHESRMRDSHMNDSRMRDSRMNESHMQEHWQGSCSHDHRRDCSTQESRMTERSGCSSASDRNECLSGFPIGMVYSPPQSFTGIMDVPDALSSGTIFTGLDLPFYHSGCKGEMCK